MSEFARAALAIAGGICALLLPFAVAALVIVRVVTQ